MKFFLKAFVLTLCAAGVASAASVFTVAAPSSVTAGSTINVDVALTLGSGDVVQGYQIDLDFPSFLSAQSLTESGYFATNSVIGGISFDTIDPTAISITTIYDQLDAADQLPGDTVLFTIDFLVTGTGTGTISVNPVTALLYGPLDMNPAASGFGLPTPVDFSVSDAMLTASSSTPEPASWLLFAGALTLFAGHCQRPFGAGMLKPSRSKR